MVLLANRFPRLISILTSAIFVSGISGVGGPEVVI